MYTDRNSESDVVTPRQFIEAWQKSESIREVARKLRRKKHACRMRAIRYRERGIPLKEIPSSPPYTPVTVKELAEYAASFLPKGDDQGEGKAAAAESGT